MSVFRRRSLPPVFPREVGTATGRLLLLLLLLSLNVCAEALIHLNLLCGIPSNYLRSSKKLFQAGVKGDKQSRSESRSQES